MADVTKLSLPQATIKVAVEFYDASEERELLKYPTAERIKNAVEHGLEISTEQFLTYYLFHRKRPGKQGWRNYREVGRHIGRAISWLDEWIDFNGESISTPPGTLNFKTERSPNASAKASGYPLLVRYTS